MRFAILIAFLLPIHTAFARPADLPWQKGFVSIAKDRSLYVEYRPAQAGLPTIFLLNGLTYTTKQWAPFVKAMDQALPGVGLVLYDMEGMGKTLLHHLPIHYEISVETQAQDLHALKLALPIPGPCVLMGLSYGGAVTLTYAAQHAGDFESYIAVSPYLERLKSQDDIIHGWVNWHRMMFPLDPRTDSELYDFYLRQVVYGTYPMVEPNVLENPNYLEGVFRLAQGAKNWRAAELEPHLKNIPLHVIGGDQDIYVLPKDLREFWDKLPESSKRSYVVLKGTAHKVPEVEPAFTAGWVLDILKGDPRLNQGLVFEADPGKGIARSGNVEIKIPTGADCEDLLRRTPRAR